MSAWKSMSLNDGYDPWRQQEHEKISELIQKRFSYLMNPKNCTKAKKLRCKHDRKCGWGCQRIYVAQAMSVSYGLKRVLVFLEGEKYYESDEYEKYYDPISLTCNMKKFRIESGVEWPGLYIFESQEEKNN